ncbi:hypothetical protein CBR_g47052 [Chara braunii]|uniref:Uncharacterized protein n=1 Tax=Chara braunii TaxID=69332 RepID=A0A388M1A7_CHABU|nr:hypothetical protein CBR_g47052 [Chara braunii]|eukprot:GBG88354.1 hypothetical protein CBR_g47052 [Chara braunii]
MVELRSGTSTTPYSKEQEERAAAILRERKERMEKRELIKQAKMLALLEEQEAKKKQMEEELKKWTKEQEEKMAAIQADVEKKEEEEKQVEEEVPLERTRGGASTSKDEEIEKTTQEWTAHLELGEDKEAEMAIPQAEREAARRELEAERDPMRRKVKKEEQQRAWKCRLSQERVRRLEAAERAEKNLKAAETRMGKTGEETEIASQGKYNVVTYALSRRADYFGAIVHYLDIGADLQQKVRDAYAQDPIYSELMKRVREAPDSEPHYRTMNGLLFEKTNVTDRLCVPNSEEIRSLILGECHDTEGHLAEDLS